MKKTLTVILFAFVLCSGFLCTGEQTARDSIAGAHGWILNAQATWGDSCRANKAQPKCVSTNKLIDAQHVAALALEAYCAGSPAPGAKSYLDGGACVPVKSAAPALKSAVSNVDLIVAEVKSFLAKGG